MGSVWKFQFRGELYTVHVQRALDDAQLRAGSKFVYADMILMLEPSSPHFSQFRGKLVVLINSQDPKRQKIDAKRLDLLQSTGHFVIVLDLPMFLCTKKKVKHNQHYLDGLMDSVMGFLDSVPTIQMPIKPGWCKGEPMNSIASKNKKDTFEQVGLDFAATKKIKPKGADQPSFKEKLAALLGATT